MAAMINIPGSGTEIVNNLEDFLRLMEEHMGVEARQCLGELIFERYIVHPYEREIEELREHYTGILRDLRELSEEMANLIQAKTLNRKKISSVAGEIGRITWENL